MQHYKLKKKADLTKENSRMFWHIIVQNYHCALPPLKPICGALVIHPNYLVHFQDSFFLFRVIWPKLAKQSANLFSWGYDKFPSAIPSSPTPYNLWDGFHTPRTIVPFMQESMQLQLWNPWLTWCQSSHLRNYITGYLMSPLIEAHLEILFDPLVSEHIF